MSLAIQKELIKEDDDLKSIYGSWNMESNDKTTEEASSSPKSGGTSIQEKRKGDVKNAECEALFTEIKELRYRKQELTNQNNSLKTKSEKLGVLSLEVKEKLEKEKQRVNELLKEKEELEKSCNEQESRLMKTLSAQSKMKDELESQITDLREKLTQESDVLGRLLRHKENIGFSLKEVSSLFRTEQNRFDIQARELEDEIEKIQNIVSLYTKPQSDADTMSTYSHVSSFGSSSEDDVEDGLDLIDEYDDNLSSVVNDSVE